MIEDKLMTNIMSIGQKLAVSATTINLIAGGLLLMNRKNQDFIGKPEDKSKFYSTMKKVIDNYRNLIYLYIALIVICIIVLLNPGSDIKYLMILLAPLVLLYAYYSMYKLYKINKKYEKDNTEFGTSVRKNIRNPLYLLYASLILLGASFLIVIPVLIKTKDIDKFESSDLDKYMNLSTLQNKKL